MSNSRNDKEGEWCWVFSV